MVEELADLRKRLRQRYCKGEKKTTINKRRLRNKWDKQPIISQRRQKVQREQRDVPIGFL